MKCNGTVVYERFTRHVHNSSCPTGGAHVPQYWTSGNHDGGSSCKLCGVALSQWHTGSDGGKKDNSSWTNPNPGTCSKNYTCNNLPLNAL